MNIKTNFWRKPIPTNKYDWSAIDDDTYDGAPDASPRSRAQGFGATEAEAIADLKEQLEEFDAERLQRAHDAHFQISTQERD